MRPRGTSTGRCRATRTSSAPSRSTSRTTCSPTSGSSAATSSASTSASQPPTTCPSAALVLPRTTTKDLQEDKGPVFAAIATLALCLSVAVAMLRGLEFKRERLAEAASDQFIAATDVADLLVKRGVPFREAHGIVG